MFGQEFNLWTDHQALNKTRASEKLHQGSHAIIKHASGQMTIQAKYNNNKNPSHQQGAEQLVDLHEMDVTR